MRSDNDTWDITTSVGATALFVAAARALEAQRPEPIAVDGYAEVFCRAAGAPWADTVNGVSTDSRLTTTDFGTHFIDFQAARTRYFDDFFAAAADSGVRQIVLLAAGLDSRAYRLPWPRGTTVFELDQPRVLEFKRHFLEQAGAEPSARRVEVAVDLRDDWPSALEAAGFEPGSPSAFIAEGLMIYLPATAQGDIFRSIDALTAPGSYVGIEEGAPMPASAFEAAKAAEVAENSPDATFFQLIYNQQYAKAQDWFGRQGWTATATPLAQQITTLGRSLPEPDSQPAQMVASNTLVTAIKPAR